MAYRDTIREQIITNIDLALRDIRTASGFNVDLGSTVKRGETISDKDQLPAVAFFPLSENNEPIPGRNNLTMTVRVEALAKFGSKNPSVVAEAMLGDVIRRMTDRTSKVCEFTEKIEYSEGGVDEYPGGGEYTVGCYALFNVNYKTVIDDPFIQNHNISITQNDTLSVVEGVST